MKIRTILAIGLLVMVLLVGLISNFFIIQLKKISIPIHKDIPEIITEVESAEYLDKLAHFIRYYDEVLTQSARNYAFTKNSRWKQRYRDAEPTLDLIIKEAIEKGDREDKEFFSSTDQANRALVEMEYRSIELVDSGRPEEAITILESKDYWEQKKIYKQGLERYAERRGINYDKAIEDSLSIVTRAIQDNQHSIRKNIHLSSLFTIVFLFIALIVGSIIFYSISSPITKFKNAVEEIKKGNWTSKVTSRGKNEIGKLSASFNEMVDVLHEKESMLKVKADALEKTNRELTDVTDQLEDKVKERTKELEESNTTLEKAKMELLMQTRIIKEANSELEKMDKIKSDFLSNLSSIFEISRVITDLKDVQKLFNAIITVVAERLDGKSASLMLFDHHEGVLTISASTGMDTQIASTVKVKSGEGIAGAVFAEGKPRLIQGEVTKYSIRGGEKISSALSVPIRLSESVLGVLNVSRTSASSSFQQRDLDFAILVANQIAVVLENTRLQAEQEERIKSMDIVNKDLQEAYSALEESTKQLKALQSQLVQSEKMSSIGQLAAGVAHEINNPIGFVNSNVNTLDDYIADIKKLLKQYDSCFSHLQPMEYTGKLKDSFHAIQSIKEEIGIDFIVDDFDKILDESKEGLERVKKIVQNLKDFSHVDQEELKETNINDGIEKTLNIVWNEIKYKISVKKEYGDIPEVSCYPQQLNQVFMNILVNAAQSIEKQGSITITTKAVEWVEVEKRRQEGFLVMPVDSFDTIKRKEEDFIEVTITDTGKGIPKEQLSKIFDPFFTTKEVGKGTGLGLSMSFEIMKNHAGYIGVKSHSGRGSVFALYIPIDDREVKAESEKE